MNYRILLVCLFQLTIVCLQAQVAPKRQLKPTEMQAELRLLKNAWEQFHPGLYRFNTPQQIDSLFEKVQNLVQQPMYEHDYFLLLSMVAHQLNCGHTYLNPWNQKDQVVQTLFSKKHLPFLFKVVDRQFIITHNLISDNRVLPGDVLYTINGISTDNILEKLLTVSRGDGKNAMNRTLNNCSIYPVDIDSTNYAMFDIFTPLFYPQLFAVDVYCCQIIKSNGDTIQVLLQAQTKQERHLAYINKFSPLLRQENSWQLQQLGNSIAHFRIQDFVTWTWKTEVNTYLDSLMQIINSKGITDLIIDIRGNEGGSDDARNILLSYLIQRPISGGCPDHRLRTFTSVPDSMRKYLKTWNVSLYEPMVAGTYTRFNDRYIEEKQETSSDTIFPAKNHFKGRVYLLTDATNSSTSFTLAKIFQQNHIGKLIGEPTAGTQLGINGGQFFLLYLPYSGFEIDLPLIWGASDHNLPDQGIEPDHFVATTRNDIIQRRDAQLEFTLQLISKGQH